MLPYRKYLKTPARRLRREMTKAERMLWARIRRGQVAGVQFYRQKPLLQFIVDFYAPAAKLVIEVDGGQHLEPEQRRKDEERDKLLGYHGLDVMRVSNADVFRDLDTVINEIKELVETRIHRSSLGKTREHSPPL